MSAKDLEEIAKTKMPDINANDIEAAKKIIAGTARSMGVEFPFSVTVWEPCFF